MTMASVTTTKRVDLAQLASETGNADLSMLTTETASTITSGTVTQAALDVAVAAHVAVDKAGNQATLRQQAQSALTANRSFLAATSPTNAQVVAQVKALTRQNNALIRLVLQAFDGTD